MGNTRRQHHAVRTSRVRARARHAACDIDAASWRSLGPTQLDSTVRGVKPISEGIRALTHFTMPGPHTNICNKHSGGP